jgi:hypothetical protein
MLTHFQCETTFYKLTVKLYVEVLKETAEATVIYDRLLRRTEVNVPFWEVSTPEKANAWFNRGAGERGSWVETLEWQCRMEKPVPAG